MHGNMHIVELKMTVVMTGLWMSFYFLVVTPVVFCVLVSTDFYLCVKGGFNCLFFTRCLLGRNICFY